MKSAIRKSMFVASAIIAMSAGTLHARASDKGRASISKSHDTSCTIAGRKLLLEVRQAQDTADLVAAGKRFTKSMADHNCDMMDALIETAFKENFSVSPRKEKSILLHPGFAKPHCWDAHSPLKEQVRTRCSVHIIDPHRTWWRILFFPKRYEHKNRMWPFHALCDRVRLIIIFPEDTTLRGSMPTVTVGSPPTPGLC